MNILFEHLKVNHSPWTSKIMSCVRNEEWDTAVFSILWQPASDKCLESTSEQQRSFKKHDASKINQIRHLLSSPAATQNTMVQCNLWTLPHCRLVDQIGQTTNASDAGSRRLARGSTQNYHEFIMKTKRESSFTKITYAQIAIN